MVVQAWVSTSNSGAEPGSLAMEAGERAASMAVHRGKYHVRRPRVASGTVISARACPWFNASEGPYRGPPWDASIPNPHLLAGDDNDPMRSGNCRAGPGEGRFESSPRASQYSRGLDAFVPDLDKY